MLREREEQLEKLAIVNGELEALDARLDTDEGVREAAGGEINFVDPGEQQIVVIDDVTLPRNLPNGWPYNISEQILTIRRAEPVAASGD